MKRDAYSGPDVERMLYCTLKDEGMLRPIDIDDIERLEDEFGRYPSPSFNIEDVAQGAVRTEKLTCNSTSSLDLVEGKVLESMAAAARNGQSISDEIRQKMRIDREREQGKNDR